MDNTYGKLERVSKILNLIRQKAQCKGGHIIIRPESKEWDAIFFAEEYLGSMAEKLQSLSDVTRRV